jgi:hypothetical protein
MSGRMQNRAGESEAGRLAPQPSTGSQRAWRIVKSGGLADLRRGAFLDLRGSIGYKICANNASHCTL